MKYLITHIPVHRSNYPLKDMEHVSYDSQVIEADSFADAEKKRHDYWRIPDIIPQIISIIRLMEMAQRNDHPIINQKPYSCPVCHGKGIVPSDYYTSVGSTLRTNEACRTCKGKGIVWCHEVDNDTAHNQ